MTVNLFLLEELAKARQRDLLRDACVRTKEASR